MPWNVSRYNTTRGRGWRGFCGNAPTAVPPRNGPQVTTTTREKYARLEKTVSATVWEWKSRF